jgi:hypothetical protein
MFSPERFARLARAHFAEHARGYAWFLAGGFLLQVVISILIAVSKPGLAVFDTGAQEAFYYLGLYVLGIIFAGRYFQSMGQRAPALLALMRPASTFEKWLLAVLVVVVLYPLAYSLLFYLVIIPDWLLGYAQATDQVARAAVEYARHPKGDEPIAFQPESYRLFLPWREFKHWHEAVVLGLRLLALQGFAMFGSLYFRNVPFIKTLLAGLLFLLLTSMLAEVVGGNPDLVLEVWDAWRPMSSAQVWGWRALWIATPVLLWLSCYLALREREITA